METSKHPKVSRPEWTNARKRLLAKEKEFTRLRDQLSAERRELPWVEVKERYVFDHPSGKKTLEELFAGHSQLVIYHFMFAPDWEAGCKSCSFWADNFAGIVEHLQHRDVSFAVVSRAPLAKLTKFAKRMGWSFEWVSSLENTFNRDYGVSFTADEVATGEVAYNYGKHQAFGTEMPGISVFYKDDAGTIFHTYSCYARGLDMMNTAYHYLDLVPKGRDEDRPMDWLRLRDEY